MRLSLRCVTLLIVASATPALANESKFEFTMEHEYVSGRKNKVAHGLDAGLLTIEGELWLTQCAPGSVGPHVIEIEVYKDHTLDEQLCTFGVTPSKPVGNRVSFSVPCNAITPSVVYIVASRTDDGCDVEARGRPVALSVTEKRQT